MDFYQVWVHGSDDFGASLQECLDETWPRSDRERGALLDVEWLSALSPELLAATQSAGRLSGVALKHSPRVLVEEAHARLVELTGGPVHRGAEPFLADSAVELLSRRIGGALVLAFRDSPAMAYAAIFRRGRCDWSYYLAPGGRVARCDGRTVFRGEEARAIQPDGDRIDLLLLGLEKFAGGEWAVPEDLRMVLPELLCQGS